MIIKIGENLIEDQKNMTELVEITVHVNTVKEIDFTILKKGL